MIEIIINSNSMRFMEEYPLTSFYAIYGRVSSHKQNKKGDLVHQIEVLKEQA